MPDVFISYSRKDKEFVRELHRALTEQKRDVWVDFEDIPIASDWRSEIYQGIESADTFIFVITPDSVNSKICEEEVTHAIWCEKRIVPLLRREADTTLIHPVISS